MPATKSQTRREIFITRETPTRQEEPDPTPMAIPDNCQHPETMEEIMRRLIRVEVSRSAMASDYGTFDDEDDFTEDDEEPDLTTPYTVQDMEEENPQGYALDPAPEQDADNPPAEPDVGADEPPEEADGTPNTPPE
jgi:hypothetical protein